jgi:ParB-like chromosome segregation protein Spo0J
MSAQHLKLAQVQVDPTIQVRARLDEDTIEHYRGVLEQLPPVLVFDIDGRLWLADGFHRLAAYRREGRATLPAIVRRGTRQEAEEAAIRENAQHGRPLTRGEKETAILRLLDRRPKLTATAIAAIVGCAHQLVSHVGKAEQVRATTAATAANIGTRAPSTTTYTAIADAPRQDWQPLVEASARQEWSAKQTADVVAELPSMTPDRRAAVLEGREPPVGRTARGELTLEPESVADLTGLELEAGGAALSALMRALRATAQVRLHSAVDVAEAVRAGADVDQVLSDIEADSVYWSDLIAALRATRAPRVLVGGARR